MDAQAVKMLQGAAQSFHGNCLAEAEAACRLLLERYPDAVDVLHLLALVSRQSGDAASAERLLRRCLAIDARRADIHANLGNLLATAGRIDESEQAYETALSLDPGFRPARLGLARLLNRRGNFGAARRHGEILVERDPRDAEAWSLLGTALRGEEQDEQAEAAWREALRIDPGYGAARYRLGAMLSDAGRSEEAWSNLERAHESGVRGPELAFARASTLMDLYRFDDAERLLAESIRADPRRVAIQSLLARLRFMRGDDGFADSFTAAVRANPGDVPLRLACARLLRGAGRLDEARAALDEGWRAQPGTPGILVELAAVHQEAGAFDAARDCARSALALDPVDTNAREAMADALLSLGEAHEAMTFIESLRRQAPLNQWYIALEATAARLLGDVRYRDFYDYERLVRSYQLPAPPGWATIEDFHRELIPVLLDRHRFRAAPLDQSLRSGTQTPRSLLGDPDPVIAAWLAALDEPLAAYRTEAGFAPDHPFRSRNTGPTRFSGCWSVLLHRGGHHVNHVHTRGWISSAYYVDVPPGEAVGSDEPRTQSGWLKFGEPRFPVPGAGPEMLVEPVAGRLVLFPSYLWHGTTPVRTSGRRLTIAFDAVPRRPS